MSHELDVTVNKAGAFIARLFPGWHNLGFTKTEGEITIEEVLDPSRGIAYEVVESAITAVLGSQVVPGYKALIRTDTNRALAIVSDGYQLINHVPEFKLFWDVVRQQDYLIETAGVLDEGKRVWILFRRPEVVYVGTKKDPMKMFLLAMFDYTGKGAITVKLVAERVVCSNTAAVAVNEKGDFDFRIIHKASAQARLDEVRRMLTGADSAFDSYKQKVEKLAATPYTMAQAQQITLDVLMSAFGNPADKGVSRDKQEAILVKIKSGAAYIQEALTNERQEAAGLGTQWALYNAISEWSDHVLANGLKTSKDPRKANESRFKSQIEGRSNNVKQVAFSALLEMADGTTQEIPVYAPDGGASILDGILAKA